MQILYLTCLENPSRNGIFESQVYDLLKNIKAHSRDSSIFLLSIVPLAYVSKKKISFPCFSKEILDKKRELAEFGIDFHCIPFPWIFMPWSKFHLNHLRLGVLSCLITPILRIFMSRKKCFTDETVVHCRSYLSTFFAQRVLADMRNARVIFDARGFYPEEGVIQKAWGERDQKYNLWKKIERDLFSQGSASIALSEPFARRILSIAPSANVHIVYASVSFDSYAFSDSERESIRSQLNYSGKKVFIYSGGLGSWHDPLMLAQIFRQCRDEYPEAVFLVLSTYNKIKLQTLFREEGIENITVINCPPREVASYLAAADVAVAPLRRIENYPMQVVADTMIGLKIAEYLAAGLPIIVNSAIGGFSGLVGQYGVGILYDPGNSKTFPSDLKKMLINIEVYRRACRELASSRFDLSEAAREYINIYNSLFTT